MAGGGDKTATQTTTQQLPEWAQTQVQGNIDLANGIAQQPLQTYDGPRIADFSPEQQQAFDIYRQQAGQAGSAGAGSQAVTDQLSTLAQNGGRGAAFQNSQATAGRLTNFNAPTVTAKGFLDANLQGYMDPYTQSVTDTTLKDLGRQRDLANVSNDTRAAAAGAFGGSRAQLGRNENERAYADAAARTSAQLNSDNFKTAQGAISTDNNRTLSADQGNQQSALQAAQLQLAAAQQQEAAGRANIGAQMQLGDWLKGQQTGAAQGLLGVGGAQQGMDQQNYDLAYQDFMRQQQYPQQQLAVRQSALSGVPLGGTTTGTTTQPSNNNWLGQGLGIGLAGLSAYNGLKGTSLFG